MKNKLFIFSAILLVAVTTITIVSCKKENTPVSSNPESTAKSFYQPPQVDDMLAASTLMQVVHILGDHCGVEMLIERSHQLVGVIGHGGEELLTPLVVELNDKGWITVVAINRGYLLYRIFLP